MGRWTDRFDPPNPPERYKGYVICSDDCDIIMNEIGQTEEFVQWFDKLRDQRVSKLIQARIKRFSLGNLGDIRGVGDRVLEARIHYGPRYRLYFIFFNETRVLYLLWGVANTLKGRILKRQKIWR